MLNTEIVVKDAAGQLVTTTTAIADGTHVQHKNVIELVRRYLADLQDFGGVAFETQPFATAGGTQHREVAMLNEPQSSLLIAYMANTEIVRQFKKALVRGFYEMRAALAVPAFNVPTTLSGALRLAAEQADTIECQAAQITAAATSVEFVAKYVDATGSKGFRQVCKLLGANESNFREFLLDKKIMYRLNGEWVPHAAHLDAGRFEVKAGMSEVSNHAFNQSRFTAKGVAWVAGEWAKYQLVEQAA